MGLLVTLYLIAWNVYGSITAPPSRGFSNIEWWISGMQFHILFAILEYSCVLALKRSSIYSKNLDGIVNLIDIMSFIISVTVFIIFNVMYWDPQGPQMIQIAQLGGLA